MISQPINNTETATQLKEKIRQAEQNRADHTEFDIHQELEQLLNSIGLSAADSGGEISFTGKDPIVPSVLRLASSAGIGMVAKSVAAAKLWRMRGGKEQDISLDLRKILHRLSPFYDRKWEKLNGYSPASPSDPSQALKFGFYQTKDGKWVMPLEPYPKLKINTLKLLNCPDTPEAVAAAIAQWDSAELEEAGRRAGIVMPVARTLEEFLNDPVSDVIAAQPLIEIEKIGDSDPEPLSTGVSSPLEGIRALGMGHVIAGAGVGRALALHGADVLNIWRPGDWEVDTTYYTANVGMRSSTLEVGDEQGQAKMQELLRGADIFFANRRPTYLERFGLSPEQAAAARPGIIHVSVSLGGNEGPWADRIGFDQTAGTLTGVMCLEGTPDKPQLPAILVVNDYIISWLAAAGAMAALARRAEEGGSYRVHISLSRVSLWLMSMGLFDKEFAHQTAGSSDEHLYLDPELFTADTLCGHYQGVTDQVHMSETPGEYRTVLVPRGSCRPEWLK
ncbi:CoA transferase [Paenibacillus dauci]|uniref:CoA transferase n=1 Tax=Paenibacillus dauci TaxID=1567106 RepID=UPI0009E23265|nr:CoA transferase [Paenibacillus dauci]